MTPAAAAAAVRRFAFLNQNAVLTAMTLALDRARARSVTAWMRPQSLTAPVHPRLLTIRTGRLARSVRVERPRALTDKFTGALIAGGLNIVYAEIHEIKGAGRLRTRRPYLEPAVRDVLPYLRERLAGGMRQARAEAGL